MTTQAEVAAELAYYARRCQNPANAATPAQCSYLAALLIDSGAWERHGINNVTSGHTAYQLTKREASQLIDDLKAPKAAPSTIVQPVTAVVPGEDFVVFRRRVKAALPKAVHDEIQALRAKWPVGVRRQRAMERLASEVAATGAVNVTEADLVKYLRAL